MAAASKTGGRRSAELVSTDPVQAAAQKRIRTVRGQQVVLDSDLADFYNVPTGELNRRVKENAARFPLDFCFRLSPEEWEALQRENPIAKPRRGGRRTPPNVFTEQGALQVAGVLKSSRADEVSVAISRAFVVMRRQIAAVEQNSPGVVELAELVTRIKHDVDDLKSTAERQSEFQRRMLDALSHMQPFLEAVEEGATAGDASEPDPRQLRRGERK